MGNPKEGEYFGVGPGSFDTQKTFFANGKRPTYPRLNPYNRRAGEGFGMADYSVYEEPGIDGEQNNKGSKVKTLAKHEPTEVYDLQRPATSSSSTVPQPEQPTPRLLAKRKFPRRAA